MCVSKLESGAVMMRGSQNVLKVNATVRRIMHQRACRHGRARQAEGLQSLRAVSTSRVKTSRSRRW
eukprot:765307-Hanusia_phi.AAC.7